MAQWIVTVSDPSTNQNHTSHVEAETAFHAINVARQERGWNGPVRHVSMSNPPGMGSRSLGGTKRYGSQGGIQRYGSQGGNQRYGSQGDYGSGDSQGGWGAKVEFHATPPQQGIGTGGSSSTQRLFQQIEQEQRRLAQLFDRCQAMQHPGGVEVRRFDVDIEVTPA